MRFLDKESAAEMRELTQALRNKKNDEARFKQLENNLKALCAQSSAEFYIWKKDSVNLEEGVLQCVHSFRTEADARKYIELESEARDLYCAIHNCKIYYPISYNVGTADEYRAAVKAAAAQAEKEQREAFSAYVIEQNEIETAEIQALESFRAVCHQFNGKIINKRFVDALRVAVKEYGFIVLSGDESWAPKITLLKFRGNERISCLHFRDNVWQKGGRLDEEAAAQLLQKYIDARRGNIKERTAAQKKFTAYVRRAKKIICELDKLRVSNCEELCRWAKLHVEPLKNCNAFR